MPWKYTEAGSISSNPTVVFLHAFALNRQMWQDQVVAFSRTNRVFAIDIPGFGESALLSVEEPTIKDFGESIFKFLDGKNIQSAVFAGSSMGGYILFELYRQQPQRVLGLIFCNTRADPDSPEVKEGRYKAINQIRTAGTASLAEFMIPRMFSKRMREIHSSKAEQVRNWILNANPKGVIDGLKAMATRVDSTETMKTIKVPTLIVTGSEDPITGESVMKKMWETIPNAQWIIIPDAGHLAPFDSPEQTSQALIDFVSKISS